MLTGKARVNTKAACKMLVMKWLQTFSELVKECMLFVDIILVRSSQNKASEITRLLQWGLKAMTKEKEPMWQV